jgi:hypothetical protein
VPVAGKRYNPLASNSRNRIQISAGGTQTDYPAASDIIEMSMGPARRPALGEALSAG